MMRSFATLFYVSGAVAIDEEWAAFKTQFNRQFLSDEHEAARYWIFKENLAKIKEINDQNHSYRAGMNDFTDMTDAEFLASHTGKLPTPEAFLTNVEWHEAQASEVLASSVDWVAKGAVTSVKNQGSCGSCWSFGTTGSLEGAWKIATGSLVPLSEQQFLDCDKNNGACNGGDEAVAFRYAEGAGICSETGYPYQAKKGTCQSSKCSPIIPKGGVTGYTVVSYNSQSALLSAVNRQPVSTGLDATTWQYYDKDVYSGCSTRISINHAVLAVGYGTAAQGDYWKIKNSWGTQWGENGYIRLLRGANSDGECGILLNAVYVKVNGNSVASSVVV